LPSPLSSGAPPLPLSFLSRRELSSLFHPLPLLNVRALRPPPFPGAFPPVSPVQSSRDSLQDLGLLLLNHWFSGLPTPAHSVLFSPFSFLQIAWFYFSQSEIHVRMPCTTSPLVFLSVFFSYLWALLPPFPFFAPPAVRSCRQRNSPPPLFRPSYFLSPYQSNRGGPPNAFPAEHRVILIPCHFTGFSRHVPTFLFAWVRN